ncbi:MAG: hypothetical protein K6T65_10090 [Peptococcaceae bacterium]|nr:hypothetical protein [Peptococcaceae bacterium]
MSYGSRLPEDVYCPGRDWQVNKIGGSRYGVRVVFLFQARFKKQTAAGKNNLAVNVAAATKRRAGLCYNVFGNRL